MILCHALSPLASAPQYFEAWSGEDAGVQKRGFPRAPDRCNLEGRSSEAEAIAGFQQTPVPDEQGCRRTL